jgi:hypothetical protein
VKHWKAVCKTVLLALVAVLLLAWAGCAPEIEGRFTYIVRYEVTAVSSDPLDPLTSANIEYQNKMNLKSSLTFDPPWSLELHMDYDYDDPFIPELSFISANFANVGDKLVLKISWKDYKVNFDEEILQIGEVVYSGVPPAGVTLGAIVLPR